MANGNPHHVPMGRKAKWPLILLNLFFLFWAIALIVLGILMLVKIKSYYFELTTNTNNSNWVAVYVIVVGVGLGAICMLGCCAASNHKRMSLFIYAILMVVIFILLCVAAAFSGVYYQFMDTEFKKELIASMPKYGLSHDSPAGSKPPPPGNTGPIGKAWDELQIGLACCGIANNPGNIDEAWKAWHINDPTGRWKKEMLPWSCCAKENNMAMLDMYKEGSETACSIMRETKIHKKDCYPEMRDISMKVLLGLMISCIILLFLVAVCIGLAVWLWLALAQKTI